jgi:hypothetical protein
VTTCGASETWKCRGNPQNRAIAWFPTWWLGATLMRVPLVPQNSVRARLH